VYSGGEYLAAWLERLGLGGREMTAAGHSKNFVLRVVQASRLLLFRKNGTTRVVGISFVDHQAGDGLP
jgi:hypothetical protein